MFILTNEQAQLVAGVVMLRGNIDFSVIMSDQENLNMQRALRRGDSYTWWPTFQGPKNLWGVRVQLVEEKKSKWIIIYVLVDRDDGDRFMNSAHYAQKIAEHMTGPTMRAAGIEVIGSTIVWEE